MTCQVNEDIDLTEAELKAPVALMAPIGYGVRL